MAGTRPAKNALTKPVHWRDYQRRLPTDYPKFLAPDTNSTEKQQRVKMVSNRLDKVHKQITKKKGKNPNLHEGSRDTKRLQSAAQRDDKLNRLSKIRENQNRTYCMHRW